ncbi:hypothetical protein [Streptomyces sp900116325]|uniref:hypothetical protein n=1 Tax=Streptomyces sp. 900116325 TaxID=3154295 RepID=UPI0033B88C50
MTLGTITAGQGDSGEQADLRLEKRMPLAPFAVAGAVLVDVTRIGIDGGYRPVRHRAPGDAPAAVGVLGRLDVLTRDQGQQANRIRRLLAQVLFGQAPEQVQGTGDQRGTGGLIVPSNLRLARIGRSARR